MMFVTSLIVLFLLDLCGVAETRSIGKEYGKDQEGGYVLIYIVKLIQEEETMAYRS